MRWALVRNVLSGESATPRFLHFDNAPFGRINEWTAPTTWLGVALAKGMMALIPDQTEQAIVLGGIWLGPILGLISMLALYFLGVRIGGWMEAACLAIAWPALEDVLSITRMGNPDHHGLHQLLFICVIGGCLAFKDRYPVRWGLFTGLSMAAALWSGGSENLPLWGLVACLMLAETRKPGIPSARLSFWRTWWVFGLMGTLAGLVYEFGGDLFPPRLEMISVWHISLWAIAGCIAEWLSHRPRSMTAQIACMSGAAALAALIALIFREFDWHHLHVLQDGRFQRQMLVTREFAPLADSFLAGAQVLWRKYALLTLVIPPLSIVVARISTRFRWLVVVAFVFLILLFIQLRWADFFVVALLLVTALGLCRVLRRRQWIAPILFVLLTLPLWREPWRVRRDVQAADGNFFAGPFVEHAILEAIADGIGNPTHPPVVLAAWDQGAILAGTGKVRVIASAYWSNLEGLIAGCDLLTTSSAAQFERLMTERQVDYVVLPPPERLFRAIAQSHSILYGEPPTREEVLSSQIWQMALNESYLNVPCPPLAEIATDWIVAMPGTLSRGFSQKAAGSL